MAFAMSKLYSDGMTEITRLLNDIERGDSQAADRLLPAVYDDLRALAARKLARERAGQTLQPTALVHEAFLRVAGEQKFANRRHFFAAAAEAMRRILVERARRKLRLKHGGGQERADVELDALAAPAPDERLLALDDALSRLAEIEPEKAQLVKLHWFAGMSLEESAFALDISPATADRWWSFARAWLRVEISGENPLDP